MDGEALISHEVLARYAADAARDVDGVRTLVDSHLPPRRAVKVEQADGQIAVEVHVAVAWGASIPEVGATVQRNVADYLARMADARPTRVDVVVDEVGPRE